MSGRIVHFEVPFDDGDRARAFYGDLFGWKLQHMPDMQYTLVMTGPVSEQGVSSEPGYINGGMMQREAPVQHPVLVIDVDDIDATLAAVGERGGSMVVPKQPVGEMGFSAYFTDPEGNLMGLWESARQPAGRLAQAPAL